MMVHRFCWSEMLVNQEKLPIPRNYFWTERRSCCGGCRNFRSTLGEWSRGGSSNRDHQVAHREDGKGRGYAREENYKYFMSWSSEKEEALVLEKMVVMRPFVREDGSKRQSWMSSLIFSDRPELVAK